MSEPWCCDGSMWLHSMEEVRDRGGDVLVVRAGVRVPVTDALVWECLQCDALRVVVTI